MFNNLKDLFLHISNKIKEGGNLVELIDSIKLYNGDDWIPYCKFCQHGYARNLVIRDDYIEMLIICWDKKQTSGIHDHPKNGCLLRVMKGQLKEKCYEVINKTLVCISESQIKKDDISYQIGKKGLHNISNMDDNSERAVSLHIYAPPDYKSRFYDKNYLDNT